MEFRVTDRAYTCTLLYPYDATVDTATYSVQLKAPDIGDTITRGRNQNFARTKSGAVYVYDFGATLSDIIKLTFTQVLEAERAALLLFLDNVTWGANLIKYIDYKGAERIVRVYKNTVDEVNQGESVRGKPTTTLYDFTLELIDMSNNPQDTDGGAVPSQLAVHIADLDNPHDPRTAVSVYSTEGTKVVDALFVDDVKHVSWFVQAHNDTTFSKTLLVHATHNGTSGSDATTVTMGTIETLVSNGTDPGDITITVTISGSGAAQVIRLNCAKTAGTVNLIIRRILL